MSSGTAGKAWKRQVYRRCARKVGHPDRAAAEWAMNVVGPGDGATVYQCRLCDQWHWSSGPPGREFPPEVVAAWRPRIVEFRAAAEARREAQWLSAMDRDSFRLALGTRIGDCRERQKLSQRALADRAGLPLEFVAGVERGTQGADVHRLLCVAAALDMRLTELLGPVEQLTGRHQQRTADEPSSLPRREEDASEWTFALARLARG